MSASRISTAQMFDGAQAHVSAAREMEMDSSDKASSLKKITRPSQDPAGWVTAANMKDDLAVRDTIAKNAGIANHVLTATENVLAQIQEYVQRTHQLAVTASSTGTVTEQNRTSILREVEGLFQNTVRALNTTYAGKSLFGGFQTRQDAFTNDGKFAGDNNKFQIEIGKGLTVPVNVPVGEIIEGKGAREGVNIIGLMQRLMGALGESDTDAIRGTLEPLIAAVDQLSIGRTLIGARQSEIERAVSAHDSEKIERLDSIANIEEADPIKAFSDLAKNQTVLKATISTSQKILTEDPLNIFFRP